MPQATTKHEPGILKRQAEADHECGDVVVVGSRIGIVSGLNAVEEGEWMTLSTWGVKTMAAKSSDAWADGDVLYWDDTLNQLTDTAGSNVKAGLADGAKLAGATTADCDVNARA